METTSSGGTIDGDEILPLHWTGSSRFSLVSMATSLAAAPGQ